MFAHGQNAMSRDVEKQEKNENMNSNCLYYIVVK